MSNFERRHGSGSSDDAASDGAAGWPGKSTLTSGFAIQRKEDPAAATTGAGAPAGASGAEPSSGAGSALPGDVRTKMERSLGADFSAVRVFAGSQLPAAVNAKAFARGNEIHFAAGQYDPSSKAGQELIGHELTHVVQQRQGRVSATVQHKGAGGAAINDDAGLEHEADTLGAKAAQGAAPGGQDSQGRLGGLPGSAAGAASSSASTVMQLREGDARAQAQAHSFSVPPVTDIDAIHDPTLRNHAINRSYHQIDAAMTGYLGAPLVANWFTFGQHASREAGSQIRNLQAGLGAMNDMVGILSTFVMTGANPAAMLAEAGRMVSVVRRLLGLITQNLLIQQAAQLALAKAGISIAQLREVVADYDALVSNDWVGLIPGVRAARLARFMYHLGVVVTGLIGAIPGLIRALQLVYNNMCTGNREIYKSVAPAASQFLAAASAAPDGVPGPVGQGFLAAAFSAYAQCRRLGDEAAQAPGTPEAAAKIAQRFGLAQRANLLVGFEEQLVILQPIFDTMQAELQAMSGTMQLNDPNGAHPLANNWGDFYTRMGIDPATAPANPRDITPANLPPLLNPGDPRRRGTISEYFNDNTDGTRTDNIHSAPTAIAPM